MNRFEMTDMDDVSRVLGMKVTRDRKKETISIDQKYSRRTSSSALL